MTLEQAVSNSAAGYTGKKCYQVCLYMSLTFPKASKAFAEKAAWQFMEKEKPDFSLTTICPTLVFGPIVSSLISPCYFR